MYLYYSCIAQKRLVSITVLSLSFNFLLDMDWLSVYIIVKKGGKNNTKIPSFWKAV